MKEAMSSSKPLSRLSVRAAIYARYSSDMQSEDSADDQIARIDYRLKKGQVRSHKYVGRPIVIDQDWIFKDEAQSGRLAGRDGYEHILKGIREKSFEVIIVDDLSRLTRSLGNLLGLYDMLKWYEVELISICDGISSEDPSAKTFFTVKGMVNDFSNDIHAERVIRGMEMRVLQGFSCGDYPYGYDSIPTKTEDSKGRPFPSHFKIIINESEAQVIRRIFQMYKLGLGYTRIAKALNEDKTPSPSASYSKNVKTKEWSPRACQHILQNEKYIGIWKWKKTKTGINPDTKSKAAKDRPNTDWVTHNGGKEIREDLRIIDQIIWDEVQKKLNENKKDPGNHFAKGRWINRSNILPEHPFSGLLECSVCASNFLLISGKKGGYYGCSAAHRQGTCNNTQVIKLDRVESTVIEILKEKLTEKEVLDFAVKSYNIAVEKKLSSAPKRSKEIEKELEGIETELKNLINFIISGNASETLNIAIKDREARKIRLNSEYSNLRRFNKGKPSYISAVELMVHMEGLKQTIIENPLRCFPVIRTLFPKKIKLQPEGKAVGGESLYSMKGQVFYNDALGITFNRRVTKNKKGEANQSLPQVLNLFKSNSIARVSEPTGFDAHENGVTSGDRTHDT